MSTQECGVHSRSYVLYQLRVRSDFALTAEVSGDSQYDLEFVRAASSDECPFAPTPSTLRYENAAAGVELHEHNSTYCLRYAEVAKFFVSDARRVACHVDPQASEILVVALLQGPVSALLLELRGFACLHASAVQIDHRAVAFMGHTGAGKSTFAMHFVARGFPLVTDDILALTLDGDTCRATPGYPQIKLRPDMAARCAADGEFTQQTEMNGTFAVAEAPRQPQQREGGSTGPDRSRYEPALGKHLQEVETGSGSFARQSLPLGAVYVLQRESQLEPTVVIEVLGPGDRFVEMLRFSFCARAIGALGLEATRFHQLGRMAELVPVRRLRYASGIENLDSVCDAVLADCQGKKCRV